MAGGQARRAGGGVMGRTVERGYGTRHQALRRQLAPLVATGQVRCARCGELIPPGAPWDLGHDDHDRRVYVGAEHRRCNRATASRRRRRRLTATDLAIAWAQQHDADMARLARERAELDKQTAAKRPTPRIY
jgi:hypothetical protein